MIRSTLLAFVFVSALALGSAAPATAQTVQCKNGYPSWANDAFTNKRQGGFICEPVPEKKAKAVAKPRPKPAPKENVAAAPDEQRATETANAEGRAAKAGNCRRYLASTGQTVEVPCAQ